MNDNIFEGNESFSIFLTTADSSVIVLGTSTSVTISDYDGGCNIKYCVAIIIIIRVL